jgi:hypothetical protein
LWTVSDFLEINLRLDKGIEFTHIEEKGECRVDVTLTDTLTVDDELSVIRASVRHVLSHKPTVDGRWYHPTSSGTTSVGSWNPLGLIGHDVLIGPPLPDVLTEQAPEPVIASTRADRLEPTKTAEEVHRLILDIKADDVPDDGRMAFVVYHSDERLMKKRCYECKT